MKKVLLVITMLTISGLSLKATNVSGGIYSNTTWTFANSPYIVTDTVVVFPGVTLTIQPGVVVKFDNNMRLELRQARLIAQGTQSDSITFTSNAPTPTQGIWSDIYKNNAFARFNFCNFRYANYGINEWFTQNLDTFIVKNSNFKYNNYGIFGGIEGLNLFDSCNFVNNLNGFYDPGLALDLDVRNCNFSNNQNDGFYLDDDEYNTGHLKNCYASYNQNYGIYAATDSVYNTLAEHNNIGISNASFVKKCTVKYNNYGLQTVGTVDSSLISNNQYGINGEAYFPSAMGVLDCIVDSNSITGIVNSAGGNITYCEIRYNGIGIDLIDSIYTITKNNIENNTIGIVLEAFNFIYCNKICNNTQYDLKNDLSFHVSVPNNYWCTADSASTEAVIYDGYDNINLGLVSFMPIDTSQCYLSEEIPNFVSQNISFKIYPNPTTENLTIETSQSSTIEISNIQGQLIKTLKTTGTKTNLNVSSFPSGVYIVEVKTEKGIAVKKFVKE